MRYRLYKGNFYDDKIIDESNNKAELIKLARKYTVPMTVTDETFGTIVFENKAQKKVNNGTIRTRW